MSPAISYSVSIELAAGLVTAAGRNWRWDDAVTADQAVNILKEGGGPVTIEGEDFAYFQTLAALHGWRFEPPDIEYI